MAGGPWLVTRSRVLAFGNFDHRQGGLLAVSERIESTYHAVREETPDGVRWEYRADPAAGFGATNCVFLVVGDLRALT